MPPSQRVRLMLPHLPSLNVQTTVVTTYSKYREDTNDPWMLELVGNEFELVKIKAFNQKWTRKIGIGDLGLRILPFLFRFLLTKANRKNTDFILFLVPPWYILTIAPLIKWIHKIPYGIDFIDPWVSESNDRSSWSTKKRLHHSIGSYFESSACKHASVIYSVSEGINQNLLNRYNKLDPSKLHVVPYGAEPEDYKLGLGTTQKTDGIVLRYIGAVWPDAYPVLDALLHSFSVTSMKNFKVEFIGTSYAAKGLAKHQLNDIIARYGLEKVVAENPLRVTYKEAVKLQLESSILLLFGGMQAYYAASKLYGMIASQKPFLAFLHQDSYPAKVLKELNYPYLVTYSNENDDLPTNKYLLVAETLSKLLMEFDNFEGLNLEADLVRENTAKGMTEKFVAPIMDYLKLKNERL